MKKYTAAEFIECATFDGGFYWIEADGFDVGIELPAGAEFAIYGLRGKCSGTITVSGRGDGVAYRDGSGHGGACRIGDGDGSAYRAGSGAGSSWRAGAGYGDSFRSGSGLGDSHRAGIGYGGAYRSDGGDGKALRTGSGGGDAKRTGTGVGESLRMGSGKGSALSELINRVERKMKQPDNDACTDMVIQTISEITQTEMEKISPDSVLALAPLNMDSLDIVELAIAIETHADIKIDPNWFTHIKTVRDVVVKMQEEIDRKFDGVIKCKT